MKYPEIHPDYPNYRFIGAFKVEEKFSTSFYDTNISFRPSHKLIYIFKHITYSSYTISEEYDMMWTHQMTEEGYQKFLKYSYKLTEDDLIIKDIIE